MRRALPFRVARGSEPPLFGPRPFSSDWHNAPPEARISARRRSVVLPRWTAAERPLVIGVVFLLVLASIIFDGPAISTHGSLASTDGNTTGSTSITAPSTVVPATMAPTAMVPQAAATPPPETFEGELAISNTGQERPIEGDPRALLPRYRVLSYYGHPFDDRMGILGEYDKEELYDRLLEEAKNYELADPSRPVMPAFELVASVAQPDPQADGSYLLHTGADIIDEYAEFTAEKGMILILDVQIGHSTVAAEIEAVRTWLELPNVHLALDPEFAMGPGEVPSQEIGSIDASDVMYAQEELAKIVEELDLPPKMLIVHQFWRNMIRNVETVTAVPGVQFVHDFDGWGEPSLKIENYEFFMAMNDVRYTGIKLFYKQDRPLLHPDEIVALNPTADFVMYQ